MDGDGPRKVSRDELDFDKLDIGDGIDRRQMEVGGRYITHDGRPKDKNSRIPAEFQYKRGTKSIERSKWKEPVPVEHTHKLRADRIELRVQLKTGQVSLEEVWERARQGDRVVTHMKVEALLQSLPGVGKRRARRLMKWLEIHPQRLVRALHEDYRQVLSEFFQKKL